MSQPPAEVDLSIADVDALLAAQHPSLRGELRRVAHGWDNDVFRLGERLAVRLPRRELAAHLVEHEQRWLPEIAAGMPVALPVPVAVGGPQGTYPWSWSIVPWFDGIPLIECDPRDRDACAEDLADALRAVHRPAPADAPVNPYRGVPMRQRDAVVRARLVDSALLTQLWDEALAAPSWHGPPVWVHGDVHPGNLIADGGRLTAIIDFGDMCGGDPACDLAIAWTGFTAAGRRRFRDRLGEAYDEATWLRARGWAIAMATAVRESDDAGLRSLYPHLLTQLHS